MIKSIKFVDEVFVYDTEKDLYSWLSSNKTMLEFAVLIGKGKKFTGHDINGDIHFHIRDHGWSSSAFRERLKKVKLRILCQII